MLLNSYRCRYCSKSFPDPSKLRYHFGKKTGCRKKREDDVKGLSETAKQTYRRTISRNSRRTKKRPTRQSSEDVIQGVAHDDTYLEGEANPVEPIYVSSDDEDHEVEERGTINGDEPRQPLTPPPEQARNDPNPPNAEAQNPPNDGPKNAPEKHPGRYQHHGYASIEVHGRAAEVIRWEYLDDDHTGAQPGPEDVLRQKEWFELAEWLATLPINNRERARYFEIERHKRGLPWQNINEFFRSIDVLEHGPDWSSKSIKVSNKEGEETFVVYKRNPVEIVRYLIGLERLDKQTKYAPERHWTITVDGRRIRVYSEMWTGQWWWRMQDLLGAGATIAPIILATDKTQLSSLGGDRAAWPVYQSIGNINKAIRRRPTQSAMLLVGYIPVAKLPWIKNEKERSRKQWEVYHESMAIILEPLKTASVIGVEMRCADGGVRRVYPMVAAHIGDWPEQCLVSCSQNSRCPVCVVSWKERGSGEPDRLRTKHKTLELLRDGQKGYAKRRKKAGLRETWPFWGDMPWVNGAATIMPDLLHQMHKGVVKSHIVKWWTRILGTDELDQRFSALPRYAGLRHFRNGITAFTQWTGTESKMVARVFLPLVAGSKPSDAVGAARAIIDFLYRSRAPQFDEDDIANIEADLSDFHDYKEIFRQQNALKTKHGWKGIPKIHMLSHYVHCTREMGTPDGYNTEGPERLHKDYVKFFYPFTSRVNAEPQLIVHLQRQEAWGILRSELERKGVVSARNIRVRPEAEEVESTYEEADDSDEEPDIPDEAMEVDGVEGDGDVDGDGNPQEATNEGAGEYSSDVGEYDSGADEVAADGVRRGRTHEKDKAIHLLSPFIQIAAGPTHPKVAGRELIADYGAKDFIDALQQHVRRFSPVVAELLHEDMPFPVWSRFSLHHDPLPFAPLVGRKIDLVRASPPLYDRYNRLQREAQFDTVLVADSSAPYGLHHYYAARVRAIFRLPEIFRDLPSEPLVYIEPFRPFSTSSHNPHQLFTTSPEFDAGRRRVAQVVPISRIRMTCHLVPKYTEETLASRSYRLSSTTDLLSTATSFYLSRHSSYYFFALMEHWRRMRLQQQLERD